MTNGSTRGGVASGGVAKARGALDFATSALAAEGLEVDALMVGSGEMEAALKEQARGYWYEAAAVIGEPSPLSSGRGHHRGVTAVIVESPSF